MRLSIRVRRAAATLAMSFAGAFALGTTPEPLVRGLDHIPVAVNDLAQAQADFERLGFVLKPGRRHADGIRNAHVKFADHTEIELITAHAATDALAAEYVAWLKHGDGPESWSLYSPDLNALTERLTRFGFAPKNSEIVTLRPNARTQALFFADREPSPTDRPPYFAHPNTAYHLRSIWLFGPPAERDLVATLGAARTSVHPCAPFASSADELALTDGDVMFLSGPHTAAARPIVGATILVRRLDSARAVLQRNRVPFDERTDCRHRSLWVRPANAHGLWLEFRQ